MKRQLQHDDLLKKIQLQCQKLVDLDSTLARHQQIALEQHQTTMDGLESLRTSATHIARQLSEQDRSARELAQSVALAGRSNNHSLNRILQVSLHNHEALLAIQRNIAAIPDPGVTANIKFTDALDRIHQIPYDVFGEWSVSL